MSDVVPYYGGRGGTWEFSYGPGNFGEIMEELDSDAESLPPVDYGDIGHDEWTIKMSLRADGLPMEFWAEKLNRRNGPLLRVIGKEVRFETLSYRMVLSRSAHDEFDRDLASLYHGFLKEIMELGSLLVNFEVSADLAWDVARWRAFFIMSPYYEFAVIGLDEHGFYTRRPDDSDREIKP